MEQEEIEAQNEIEVQENNDVESQTAPRNTDYKGFLKFSLIFIGIIALVTIASQFSEILKWVDTRIDIARSPTVLEFSNYCPNRPPGEVIQSAANGMGGPQYIILKGEKSVAVYSDFSFKKRLYFKQYDGAMTKVKTQFTEPTDIINQHKRSVWDFGGFTVSVVYESKDGPRLDVFGISPYWQIYSSIFGSDFLKDDEKIESAKSYNKILSDLRVEERYPLKGKPVAIDEKFAQVCDISLDGLEFVGINHGILANTNDRKSLLLLDKNGRIESKLDFGKNTAFFQFYETYIDNSRLYAYDGRYAYEISEKPAGLWVETKADTGEDGNADLASIYNKDNMIITNYHDFYLFNGRHYLRIDFVQKETSMIEPFLSTKNWQYRIFEQKDKYLLADFGSKDNLAYEFPYRPVDSIPLYLTEISNYKTDLLYWKDDHYNPMYGGSPLGVVSYDVNCNFVIAYIMPEQSNCIGIYETKGVSGEAMRFFETFEIDEETSGSVTNLFVVTKNDIFRCKIDSRKFSKLKPGRIFLGSSGIRLRPVNH